MKKKVNPIIVAIIILLIVFCVIIYLYINPSSSITSTSTSTTETTEEGVTEVQASIQTIENTLSSSGEIESALDEQLSLHASYYFDELLVEENVLISEGANILSYTNGTYLTAPYDCVVISSNLPNQDEECTTSHYVEVKSIDSLAMSLSVSEEDIHKVEIGDAVDITITASNEQIQGYITSISEVGTYSSSGSYFDATVTFENTGNLKIGMSATCEIIIESAENVVAVPVEAVQTSDSGSYVVVVGNDGTTSEVTVETGISNDAYIEIKSGITENTTVQMTESESSTSSFQGGRGANFQGGGGGEMNFPSGMEMPSGGDMPSMPGGF